MSEAKATEPAEVRLTACAACGHLSHEPRACGAYLEVRGVGRIPCGPCGEYEVTISLERRQA